MFILGKDGRIVARAPGKDNKPAPFVSDTAKWDGEKWLYDDPVEEAPSLSDRDCLTAYDLQCYCIDLLSPPCGSYRKPKTKEYSILIPAYGKKEFLADAINSCLAQTVLPKEVVVLDMDDEFGYSEDPIVRVVKHARLNAAAARNLLVELCKTEQFIFLDADDELESNFAEVVLSYPQNIVGTAVKHMEKDGHVQENGQFVGWENRPFTIVNYNLTSLLCKEAWNELGGLDEQLAAGGEDSDFGFRIFERGKWDVAFTSKTHLHYRINVGGLSTKKEFLKSKELELHKHAEKMVEWLGSAYEPRDDAREWVLKWRPIAQKILKNFMEIWPYRKEGDLLMVPAAVTDCEQFCSIVSTARWLKDNAKLVHESAKRPTATVCVSSSPRINGRAVDLVIDSYPTKFVDESKVAFNSGLDLSLKSEQLMREHNVVWLKPISEFFETVDLKGHNDEPLFSGREAALF